MGSCRRDWRGELTMGAGLENPYAWIGLPVGSTPRDLRRKLSELKVQADIGSGPSGVTPERLVEAGRLLEDPVSRLQVEFLWLVGPAVIGYSPPVIRTLQDVQQAISHLESEPSRSTAASAHTLDHDLGVLEWARFLEDPRQHSWLASALKRLAGLQRDQGFWQAFEATCVEAGDARSASELARLRAEHLDLFIEPAVSAIRASNPSPSDVGKAIQAIRAAGLPDATAQAVVDRLMMGVTAAADKAIDELAAAVSDLRSIDENATAQIAAKVKEVQTRLRDGWQPAVLLPQQLDPESPALRLGDRFARELERLAPYTWPKADMGPLAIRTMQIAAAAARSPSVVSDVLAHQAILRSAYHERTADACVEQSDWTCAAAQYEFASEFAVADERAALRHFAAAAKARLANAPAEVARERARIEHEISQAQANIGKPAQTRVSAPVSRTNPLPPPPLEGGRSKWTWVGWGLAAIFAITMLASIVQVLSGDDRTSASRGPATSARATATVTSIPRRTPTPAATTAGVARTPSVLWGVYDDFSGSQAMPSDDPSVAESEIEDGVLKMSVKQPGWSYWLEFGEVPPGRDFSALAKVSRVAGDGAVAVALGSSADSGTWVFAADARRSTWAVYLDQGGDEPFAWEVVPRYTSAIASRGLKTITVTMVDSVPIFRINGIDVAAQDGIPLPVIRGSRTVSLRLDAADADAGSSASGISVWFDEFLLDSEY